MKRNVVVVTGAATGFGRLTAEMLARHGHIVYAGLRDVKTENRDDFIQLNRLREEGSFDIRPIELDVLYEESCR